LVESKAIRKAFPMTNRSMTPLRWLGLALVVAIGLMVVFGTLAMTTYGGYYGMMGSAGWPWGLLMMGIPGVFLVLLLLAALGGLEGRSTGPSTGAPPNPLEILDQRYARGELSREDYLRIRDDLGRRPNNS
jgi:putative membrane protein